MSASGAANTLLWIIIIIVAVILLVVILERFVFMAAPLGLEGQAALQPKLFYLLKF
jgi:flagellar basal body-associated protein FliL